jgi:hypothetical protein
MMAGMRGDAEFLYPGWSQMSLPSSLTGYSNFNIIITIPHVFLNLSLNGLLDDIALSIRVFIDLERPLDRQWTFRSTTKSTPSNKKHSEDTYTLIVNDMPSLPTKQRD